MSPQPPILQDRVGLGEQAAAHTGSRTAAEFLENVVRPMLNMEGDKLPVRCALGHREWMGGGMGDVWVCVSAHRV